MYLICAQLHAHICHSFCQGGLWAWAQGREQGQSKGVSEADGGGEGKERDKRHQTPAAEETERLFPNVATLADGISTFIHLRHVNLTARQNCSERTC